MSNSPSFNQMVYALERKFWNMFLVFPVGLLFCYRTDSGVYFVIDSNPSDMEVIIHFAQNLNCAEAGAFSKSAVISASDTSLDKLFQTVIVEILKFDNELPQRTTLDSEYVICS